MEVMKLLRYQRKVYKAVIETLKIEDSPWTKLVKKDCKKLKIRWKRLIPLAQNRFSFSKVTHWRIFGS